jgi:hypothetical protein
MHWQEVLPSRVEAIPTEEEVKAELLEFLESEVKADAEISLRRASKRLSRAMKLFAPKAEVQKLSQILESASEKPIPMFGPKAEAFAEQMQDMIQAEEAKEQHVQIFEEIREEGEQATSFRTVAPKPPKPPEQFFLGATQV